MQQLTRTCEKWTHPCGPGHAWGPSVCGQQTGRLGTQRHRTALPCSVSCHACMCLHTQVYTNLTDFTDRELANLMWSLAVLEHRPTWVLGPLLSGAADSFPAYSANALHLVGWACGKLGYW